MARKHKDGDRFADLEQAVNDALRLSFEDAEFLAIWGEKAHVRQFGSQFYNLATSTSDFDYYLYIPARHVEMSKVIRAIVQQLLCDRKVAVPHACDTGDGKATLSWTYVGRDKIRASLNVSPSDHIRGAMLITAFLADYYADNEELRGIVKAVATRLREKTGFPSIHGHEWSCQTDFKIRSLLSFVRRLEPERADSVRDIPAPVLGGIPGRRDSGSS